MVFGCPARPEVVCGRHGPTRYRPECDWWVCNGFDGEGCCTIPDEVVYDIMMGVPLPQSSPLLPMVYSMPLGKIVVKYQGADT